MTVSGRSVLLFPGQGAYDERVLPALAQLHPEVSAVIAAIDGTATRLGTEPTHGRLLSDQSPSLKTLTVENPDLLQLAIYGTSVVLSQIARSAGTEADALMGHSFGEITALVAGGAYTVEEGAEVVLQRNMVLREIATEPGAMIALGTSRERVEHILDVVGDPLTVVAVENAPRQTVVSGPRGAVDIVAEVAAAVKIATYVLSSPYAFHSPLLARGVAELSRRLRHMPGRPLLTPVYSPILGRYLRPDDDLGVHLARCLVAPVRFVAAIRQMHDAGARTFIECGAGKALSLLVQRCLPSVSTVTLTTANGTLTTPPPLRRYAGKQRAIPVPTRGAEMSVALPSSEEGTRVSPERADIWSEIVAMYAAALEYPVEVFTEKVALEADLGIDSMKQAELLARAADHYVLPDPPQDFQLSDYDTMGKIVDYLWSRGSEPPTAATPTLIDKPAAQAPVSAAMSMS